MCICTYTHISKFVYTRTYAHKYTHSCSHPYTRTHTQYIYIYIDTHTHTHTHISSLQLNATDKDNSFSLINILSKVQQMLTKAPYKLCKVVFFYWVGLSGGSCIFQRSLIIIKNIYCSIVFEILNFFSFTYFFVELARPNLYIFLCKLRRSVRITSGSPLWGIWRCPWYNGYRRMKWTQRHEFKSWTRLIAFHTALIPLRKVWIQLFSLQLWVNSRAD